jgi:hypothetical protein
MQPASAIAGNSAATASRLEMNGADVLRKADCTKLRMLMVISFQGCGSTAFRL